MTKVGRLSRLRQRTLRQDAVAGLVLGVQSVPDGLATGLLAGVNPMAGLYGYLVGTITGAVVTSSVFMVVQGTGAMAMVVADVPAVHGGANADSIWFRNGILRLGQRRELGKQQMTIHFPDRATAAAGHLPGLSDDRPTRTGGPGDDRPTRMDF